METRFQIQSYSIKLISDTSLTSLYCSILLDQEHSDISPMPEPDGGLLKLRGLLKLTWLRLGTLALRMII